MNTMTVINQMAEQIWRALGERGAVSDYLVAARASLRPLFDLPPEITDNGWGEMEKGKPPAAEKLAEEGRVLLAKATPGPWVHRQVGVKIGSAKDVEADWIGDAPANHSKIICERHSFYGGSPDYALVSWLVNNAEILLAALAEKGDPRAVLIKVLESVEDEGK